MGKTIAQKNNQQLLRQQKTELEKLQESLPVDTLRAAEDKVLAQCLEIVEGSLDFASLGFLPSGEVDETQIPMDWQLLSPEAKTRKIRLAKYACLTTRDVPFGVKAAFSTLMAITRNRSAEKGANNVFNMEVSLFPAPSPINQDPGAIDAEFEVIDLD